MNDDERFDALVSKMKERLPTSSIKYKDESTFMEKLDKVLFFNKAFMTCYTTTIDTTVYFPTRKEVEANKGRFFYTLCHEYVHAWDANNSPVLFNVGYLFPQILALLSLGAFLAFINIWFLLFLFALLFLAPIPSPSRTWAELRGYGMSCKVEKWKFGKVDKICFDSRIRSFIGPGYYFMWPFKKCVRAELRKYIETDECLKDKNPAYKDVYKLTLQ